MHLPKLLLIVAVPGVLLVPMVYAVTAARRHLPAQWLVCRAARSLPVGYQARYEEEWLAELIELQADRLGALWVALRIRHDLRAIRRLLLASALGCALGQPVKRQRLGRRATPLDAGPDGIGRVLLVCFGERSATRYPP